MSSRSWRRNSRIKGAFMRNREKPDFIRHAINFIDTAILAVMVGICMFLVLPSFYVDLFEVVMLIVLSFFMFFVVLTYYMWKDTIKQNSRRTEPKPERDTGMKRFIESENMPMLNKVLITLAAAGLVVCGMIYASTAMYDKTVLIGGYNVAVITLAAKLAAIAALIAAASVISRIIMSKGAKNKIQQMSEKDENVGC